jgi:hypothetical protein
VEAPAVEAEACLSFKGRAKEKLARRPLEKLQLDAPTFNRGSTVSGHGGAQIEAPPSPRSSPAKLEVWWTSLQFILTGVDALM